MNDRRKSDLDDEHPKKNWVVQKLPIKGGNVLRSAMLTEEYWRKPDWVQIEGEIKS
jgi:hypothetical protein